MEFIENIQEVIYSIQNLSFSFSSQRSWEGYYYDNQKQSLRNSILLLPNEVMSDISKHLSKRDYKQCMLVCKSWFFRFFGITYGQIIFTQLEQINQFNSLIKHAKSCFSEAASIRAMTDSVTNLSLNEVENPLGYLYSDPNYQSEVIQVFNNLRNIQVLNLSWLQVHSISSDNHYDGICSSTTAWPHIRELRWLKISKRILTTSQHSNMQSLMMTYPSRHNLTTISNVFESLEYVLDLLRGFPLLESFTLAFTASEDRRWIGTEYLDYIHQQCPRLQTFRLDNAPLYVTTLSDQESTNSFASPADTQKMQHLELKSPVFYNFEQSLLFHTYIKYKYKSILSLKVPNILITTCANNNSRNTTSFVSLPLEKQLSTPPSNIWGNLEQLKFMTIRSSSALSLCKAVIQEAGKNGKLTFIYMSGEYVRKNKVNPIVVNLAWIREFCPYLKTLDMNYISLLNSDAHYLDDDILFDDNGSKPVFQGTLFRKLCLGRDTSTFTWNVHACKFDLESTKIKAIVAD